MDAFSKSRCDGDALMQHRTTHPITCLKTQRLDRDGLLPQEILRLGSEVLKRHFFGCDFMFRQ